jgi:hypothetical protein
MERARTSRWIAVALASGAALVVLVVVVLGLSQEATRTAPPPTTPVPTSITDPVVATVNGQPIGRHDWSETVLLDQVMSRLAGVPAPSAEETLERLINEALVLQAAPQEPPSDRDTEAQIATLEAAWGVTNDQTVGALEAAGLGRDALVRAVTRLLMVQRAQEALTEAEEISIEDWLLREREDAEIAVHREQMQAALVPPPTEFLPPQPTPTTPPSPLPTAQPLLSVAPDFTLERAGGGSFTLSEHLARGPVVLVFFQRCG